MGFFSKGLKNEFEPEIRHMNMKPAISVYLYIYIYIYIYIKITVRIQGLIENSKLNIKAGNTINYSYIEH